MGEVALRGISNEVTGANRAGRLRSGFEGDALLASLSSGVRRDGVLRWSITTQKQTKKQWRQ